MAAAQFGGDKKKGDWLLASAERRMVAWMVPKVPGWLETYHLTMLTLAWSIGIVLASMAARQSLHWLWLVSAFIALQYLTDVLDGAVGRHRNTGLVKWGFYMDHFLDFIFLSAIIAGYALLLPDVPWYWFMGLQVLGGALMINMFLSFAATNEFQISALKMGPTEGRLFFVLINTGIILFGTAWLELAIPFLVPLIAALLVWMVFGTQRHIWRLDMDYKKASQQYAPTPPDVS